MASALLARVLIPFCIAAGLSVLASNKSHAQATDTQSRDMPSTMRGFLGVELNRDDFASVKRRLGNVAPWWTGDAGEAEVWWCYRSPAQGGRANTVLLLSSDGEMGGDHHEVDEIRLLRSARADTLLSHCAALPGNRSLSTPGGLRLGLSREGVVALLGTPKASAGDSIAYEWQARRELLPSEPGYAHWNARRKECFEGHAPYIDISSGVVVQFDQRGAAAIRLWRFDESIC